MLYLRSLKGGCCSISDDLSFSLIKVQQRTWTDFVGRDFHLSLCLGYGVRQDERFSVYDVCATFGNPEESSIVIMHLQSTCMSIAMENI